MKVCQAVTVSDTVFVGFDCDSVLKPCKLLTFEQIIWS